MKAQQLVKKHYVDPEELYKRNIQRLKTAILYECTQSAARGWGWYHTSNCVKYPELLTQLKKLGYDVEESLNNIGAVYGHKISWEKYLTLHPK